MNSSFIFLLFTLLISASSARHFETTSPIPVITSSPESTTIDPCDWCQNTTITITDTWAGHCFPLGEGASCNCVCGHISCRDNELIDRSTCTPDGRLEDCRCISATTTALPPATTIDPCYSCRNTTIHITDAWAGHCFPLGEGDSCGCVCGHISCRDNEVIDRSTCTPDGRFEDCRCISATTTISPTTNGYNSQMRYAGGDMKYDPSTSNSSY